SRTEKLPTPSTTSPACMPLRSAGPPGTSPSTWTPPSAASSRYTPSQTTGWVIGCGIGAGVSTVGGTGGSGAGATASSQAMENTEKITGNLALPRFIPVMVRAALGKDEAAHGA